MVKFSISFLLVTLYLCHGTVINIPFFNSVAWGGEKHEISELKWKYRPLIWHSLTKETVSEVITEFKVNKQCEIIERKIKIILFVANENDRYQLPDFILNRIGVWLIGLDGSVKYFSQDSFDPELFFALIDAMPMRQSEIGTSKRSC